MWDRDLVSRCNGALTAASMLPSLPGRLLSTPTPAASASDPEETTTFSYGRDSGLNAGEPIVAHMLLMDAPSVNFGAADEASVVGATVDPWHFDSVAYVGVALISVHRASCHRLHMHHTRPTLASSMAYPRASHPNPGCGMAGRRVDGRRGATATTRTV